MCTDRVLVNSTVCYILTITVQTANVSSQHENSKKQYCVGLNRVIQNTQKLGRQNVNSAARDVK